MKIKNKNYGENHSKCVDTMSFLGGVYCMLGDIDLSRDFLLKSLDISNKQYREKHYSSGNILFYLGNTYRSSGDLGKARENYELAKDVLQ